MTGNPKNNPRKTRDPEDRKTGTRGVGARGTKDRPPALWLGAGKGGMDMGYGRGPRRLEPHELLSWFFSRDGH